MLVLEMRIYIRFDCLCVIIMKLSISTLAFYPAKIEDVLEFITKQNFDYLEIVKEYPYNNLTLDDFSSYDINLSVHAPMSDVNIASHVDKIRRASVSAMEEAFCKASQWGADRVVVHPGSIPVMGLRFTDKILEYNRQSLLECKKLADDYGIMMCLENMPLMDNLLYTNIEALFQFVEDELYSGITMDVGHAHNNAYTPEEMFDCDYIHHVHLSDNDGSFDMHDALGSHNIDFVKIFDILDKKKYDDICVIEVKSLANVYKSIDYLKSIGIM